MNKILVRYRNESEQIGLIASSCQMVDRRVVVPTCHISVGTGGHSSQRICVRGPSGNSSTPSKDGLLTLSTGLGYES